VLTNPQLNTAEPSEESPRTHKKDKQEVIGEVFEIKALQVLLDSPTPLTSVSRDYQLLLKAYRHLPVVAFKAFLPLYQQAGYDLNPEDAAGQPFLSMIQGNRRHLEYAQLLAERIAAQ
jgi:hypothetical protein